MKNENRKTPSGKNTDQTKKTWMPPELSMLDMEETNASVGSASDGGTLVNGLVV